MMWYSENFIFLLAAACMGAGMATLSGIGCFVLALFGKEESIGEVKVGKFFNVKGVSLIMLGVCGVALMGGSVYAWVKINGSPGAAADAFEYDWGYVESLGYMDEADEWYEEGGVEVEGLWPMAGDDDSALSPPIVMPDEVRRVLGEATREHNSEAP